MKVSDIAEMIEEYAPLSLAASYDNSGIQIESHNDEVSGIVVALDMTKDVIDKAIDEGANLIVTHHPILFSPIKQLRLNDYTSSLVMKAVKHNIAVYASHTNFDNCNGGITDSIMSALGVLTSKPLEDDGTGRVGEIERKSLVDIVKVLSKFIGESALRVSGDMSKAIGRIAVINGAGGRDESIVDVLQKEGVELFITGETKHSLALKLKSSGIALIDIEHYSAEKVFVDIMGTLLEKSGCKIIKFKETNPYNFE